jgi:hypothetical protein
MLGRKHGLYPTNTDPTSAVGIDNTEIVYEIDSNVDLNHDLMEKVWATLMSDDEHHPHLKDKEAHKRLKKDLLGKHIPAYFAALEERLK